MPISMEKSTAPTSAQNRLKLPIATGASRSKIICFGTLCLAVGIANSLALTNTYDYRGVCPTPDGGKRILDKWNEWICECTSYAADKLNERGVPFTSRYEGVRWKSAGNWINAATLAGVPYNKTPRRGDVAWFAAGHVAYVEAVDSYYDVTISEYNWGTQYNYHTRTINRGSKAYPTYFIHF
jgi:CHAP domain-containing protein